MNEFGEVIFNSCIIRNTTYTQMESAKMKKCELEKTNVNRPSTLSVNEQIPVSELSKGKYVAMLILPVIAMATVVYFVFDASMESYIKTQIFLLSGFFVLLMLQLVLSWYKADMDGVKRCQDDMDSEKS
ncbi:hypothetical protein RGL65_001401 [Vibrio parahaemolyticus]|nr:hypothetical protein [Vibrio parahaemolyticus]